MDPVPMFVGDVDGARRHAVGAGLTPRDGRRHEGRDRGDRPHCPYGNVSVEAALRLRFRIYQKTSRGGGWIRVGDDMLPLTVVEAGTSSR
jgi:hypothetical protein